MIGAVCYRLRAENDACLPAFHGRLLHGVMFALIQDMSPGLASFIHENMNSKPFTVSLLAEKKQDRSSGKLVVHRGSLWDWRVTATCEEMLTVLLSVPLATRMQVGKAVFSLQKILADGSVPGTGIVDEKELMAGAFNIPKIQKITFQFDSPVSFRNYDRDYPFPLPEFVFGSLADKWQQAGMPAAIDRKMIKETASCLRLLEWCGSSRRVYFARDRGMLAFSGTFSYDVGILPQEQQQIFLMLAQIAAFSGTGRLTAQGFGQTKVLWS